MRSILNEQRDLSIQAASHCLSAIHLKQLLFIYNRYFVALARCKVPSQPTEDTSSLKVLPSITELTRNHQNKACAIDSPSTLKDAERAAMGLARVGTRAALNFSFAFLRRAWGSGEDTELCSELLNEALEALQTLPEASLFDSSQVSSLWYEVFERSVKFLRQVVLGDVISGRCPVPKSDKHIALSLLLELGSQKGTLSASLDAILLLLTLWDKEKDSDDNREPTQKIGAPLVTILRRYEKIANNPNKLLPEGIQANPTESFLRFLTLPDDDTANIDLRQAAVVIVSHLDRLAKSHLPTANITSKVCALNLNTNPNH